MLSSSSDSDEHDLVAHASRLNCGLSCLQLLLPIMLLNSCKIEDVRIHPDHVRALKRDCHGHNAKILRLDTTLGIF